jgi:hypothetical protein
MSSPLAAAISAKYHELNRGLMSSRANGAKALLVSRRTLLKLAPLSPWATASKARIRPDELVAENAAAIRGRSDQEIAAEAGRLAPALSLLVEKTGNDMEPGDTTISIGGRLQGDCMNGRSPAAGHLVLAPPAK